MEQKSIFHKHLVVETRQTLYLKCHVSISFSNNSYLSSDWKCSKMAKQGQQGPKEVKIYISRNFVVETWYTPHFNQICHVTVLYSFHTSQMTGMQFSKMPKQGQKGPKRGFNGDKIYISRTFRRRNLVDLYFNQKYHAAIRFSYISYLSDDRKC